MQKQIIKLTINVLAFYIASIVFPGVEAASVTTFIYAGVILWLVNLLIRPLLLLISLPVTLLTLGLFSLVVNTWMVMLADKMIRQLYIPGFWIAFAIALIISFFNVFFKDLSHS